MNKKQIQIEVCKALLDFNRRCCGGYLNEEEFAVTTDGFSAFVFHKNECIFDIEKIRKMDFKNLFSDNEEDEEMKPTNELFKVDNRTVEKYKTETNEIYVFADVSKPFKGFHFFTASSQSRILVKDDFGRLVGLFLPMKFSDKYLRR